MWEILEHKYFFRSLLMCTHGQKQLAYINVWLCSRWEYSHYHLFYHASYSYVEIPKWKYVRLWSFKCSVLMIMKLHLEFNHFFWKALLFLQLVMTITFSHQVSSSEIFLKIEVKILYDTINVSATPLTPWSWLKQKKICTV